MHFFLKKMTNEWKYIDSFTKELFEMQSEIQIACTQLRC